jgi:hypothetical protein
MQSLIRAARANAIRGLCVRSAARSTVVSRYLSSAVVDGGGEDGDPATTTAAASPGAGEPGTGTPLDADTDAEKMPSREALRADDSKARTGTPGGLDSAADYVEDMKPSAVRAFGFVFLGRRAFLFSRVAGLRPRFFSYLLSPSRNNAIPTSTIPLPSQVIAELNKHIVGQLEAKRAVAIALRNRWRRQRLPELMRREIVPRNILMIGPTGCGKTEIARRLSQMLDAPFVKVRA